jgi:hypothetical protein
MTPIVKDRDSMKIIVRGRDSRHTGLRVFVYYNLHKHLWSVKALEGEHKGRVIAHREFIILQACRFKVSQAGRQRVLRERRKNVHAGVTGRVLGNVTDMELHNTLHRVEVTYNPYKYDSFVCKEDTNQKVVAAEYVVMNADKTVEAYTPTVFMETMGNFVLKSTVKEVA